MVSDSCPVAVSENRAQPDEGPLNGGGNYDPLKVDFRTCLSKIWLYAGIPENPTLLVRSPILGKLMNG